MLIDDNKLLADGSSSREDDASDTLGGPSIRERPFSDTTLGQPSIRLPHDPPPSFSALHDSNATPAETMASPRRRRFRESLSEIPTPGSEAKRPPRFEPIVLRTWVVLLIAAIMIVMAFAIEVALFIAYKHNGESRVYIDDLSVINSICQGFMYPRRTLSVLPARPFSLCVCRLPANC
jgi:hypothetical protein